MVRHTESHPMAGKTVKIISGKYVGHEYRLEDWWDTLTGGSWGDAKGNPAAMIYAFRTIEDKLPSDDEVVYGKIDSLGYLVHASELGEEV